MAQLAMAEDRSIVLSTYGSLLRNGYRMDVTRWRCERSVQINLAAFPSDMSYIGRQYSCRCEERCWPSISMPLANARAGNALPHELPS